MGEKRSVLDVLPQEELDAIPETTDAEIRAALEKGRLIREEAERNAHTPILPRIVFKN